PVLPPSSSISSFFTRHATHPALPSFPTRRSSDLASLLRLPLRDALRLGPLDGVARPRPSVRRRRAQPGRAGAAAWSAAARLGIQIGRAPSELQSRSDLVCRLLLEKKKTTSARCRS